MSTQGVGTFLIEGKFASGSLVFYEKAVGRTATGDVLTIGTTAVKVGNTSQDVDFQVYGTGSKSFIIDIGASTATLTGITLTTANKGISVTDASLNATTGRIAKFDGTVLTPSFGDGYGSFECNLNIGTGAVAGYVATGSFWINLGVATTTFTAGNCISPLDVGIWGITGMTMTNSKIIMGLKMSCVIDDGANPGSLFLFNTNIYANALTALFDVNTIVDYAATATAASTGGYKLPFCVERSTGTTWYMNIYTS
jgi:hypothetical protein